MNTESPIDCDDLSTLFDSKMSDEDKTASNNIGKFLASLPLASCSQFLTAISSKEFLGSFSTSATRDDASLHVKFEHGNNDYAAFAANELYKCQYNVTTLFGKRANVPVQTFASLAFR